MSIDSINLVRIITTLVSFAFFIWIVVWAWSARNRKNFDEAARLPFEEE